MQIKELFESKKKALKIDLDRDTSIGDKTLLDRMSVESVDEVDADELEKNTEGNLDGTLLIWMGDDSVEVTGENFSPLFGKFNTLSDKKKASVLDELKEKIKQ